MKWFEIRQNALIYSIVSIVVVLEYFAIICLSSFSAAMIIKCTFSILTYLN